jgi:hypothetical protein
MKATSDLLAKMLPSRSSVLRRVPAQTRHDITRALLTGEDRTYRDLYAAFGLKDMRVSFTAFYSYARRIRRAAALAELYRTSIIPDERTHEALADAIAERLRKALEECDEGGASLEVARLSRAYRSTQMALVARRQARLLDPGQRPDSGGDMSSDAERRAKTPPAS